MVYRGSTTLTGTAGLAAFNTAFTPNAYLSQTQQALCNSFQQTKFAYLVVKLQSVNQGQTNTAVLGNCVATGILDSQVTIQDLNELLDKCPSAKPVPTGAVNVNGMGQKVLFKPITNEESSYLTTADFLAKQYCRIAFGFQDLFNEDGEVIFTWYLKCYHKRN